MASRVRQLEALLAADPGDAFCMYGLALEHAKIGNTAEAVLWFDRTLAADPHYLYAYFHKAKAQVEAGDALAARATLGDGLRRARAVSDLKAAGEMEALLDELEE